MTHEYNEIMEDLIIQTSLIRNYSFITGIVYQNNMDEKFVDVLWNHLLNKADLMDEFSFYVSNHEFKDEVRCEGFALTDIYVQRIANANLMNDYGKNSSSCNKDAMVLETFLEMARLMDDPKGYKKVLESDLGMDKF